MGVVWAEPRKNLSLGDCEFYHTMDIPGHGVVEGLFDLRGGEKAYLGNVDLKGKRVLELGPASGHLCFSMETMGAEVVSYDLSDEQEWDIVPYAGYDCAEHIRQRKLHMRKINNGYWLAHEAFNSKAKVAYGSVYDVPGDIGQFDVCTFCTILLHIRDPFLALQRATAHVRETVIVTDLVTDVPRERLLSNSRMARFVPDADRCEPYETWWWLAPGLIAEFLKVLGFGRIEFQFHTHPLHSGVEKEFCTVIGRRGGSSSPSRSEGDSRPALEEIALSSMKFSRIARHLVRRGLRAAPRRLLGKR
jgi:hypothetical protein